MWRGQGAVEVACGSGRAGPTGCLQVRVLFTDPSDGADCTPLIQRAHGEAAGSGQQVTPCRVASARGAPARSRPRGSRTTAAERGGRAGTLRPETPTSWPFTEKPWPPAPGLLPFSLRGRKFISGETVMDLRHIVSLVSRRQCDLVEGMKYSPNFKSSCPGRKYLRKYLSDPCFLFE